MLGAKKASSRRGPQITVQVVFLKSYDRMGRARVMCSGGRREVVWTQSHFEGLS